MYRQTQLKVADRNPTVDPTTSVRHLGILVIEDNPVLLKAIERGLIKRGFVVWTASDGEAGVERYRHSGDEIDLVLSDLNMPVMDGVETLKALKSIEPRVRFCFMTGDGRQSTITKLLELGSLQVFGKPFSSVAEVAEELRELATRQIGTAIDVSESGRSGDATPTLPVSSSKSGPVAVVASWFMRTIGWSSHPSPRRPMREAQSG